MAEVSEEDDEDVKVDGVTGYMGGITCDGAGSVGGHGGINGVWAGRGVRPNVQMYLASC